MGIMGIVSIASQPDSVEPGEYKRESKSYPTIGDSTLSSTVGDSTLSPTLSPTLVSTEGSSSLYDRFMIITLGTTHRRSNPAGLESSFGIHVSSY